MSKKLVDITGLDKADVLAWLYNGARPARRGSIEAQLGSTPMGVERARNIIDGRLHTHDFNKQGSIGRLDAPVLDFGYVYGRPLNVDLRDTTFDPSGYDRANRGRRSAERVIKALRMSKGEPVGLRYRVGRWLSAATLRVCPRRLP